MARRIMGLVVALGLVAATGARADFLTVTESTTLAGGSLNGVAFANRVITLTEVVDTTKVTEINGNTYVSALGTISFSIAGIGSGSLAGSVFSDQGTGGPNSAAVGLSAANGNDILYTIEGAYSTYNLGYSFSTSGMAIDNEGEAFSTSAGDLVLGYAPGLATFNAVPEPSSLVLCVVGGSAVAGAAIRRHRSAA